MARKKGSRRGVGRTHSALVTIFGAGVALAPLINNPNGGATPSPLTYLQQGNWAAAAGSLSNNVTQYWASYLTALLLVVVVALIIRKVGRKAHISRHWTV